MQQELEKLHDLRNKVKLEGEQWDELVSSSSQNSHMVQRATRLWDSLLSRKSKSALLILLLSFDISRFIKQLISMQFIQMLLSTEFFYRKYKVSYLS